MGIQRMIDEKNEEKQLILSKMEEKKIGFMSELAKFTPNWFEEQTLKSIKENPSKLLAIGEEKAKELKTKIKELQDNSISLVERYINQSSLWWHLNGANSKRSYSASIRQLLPELYNEIGFLFGELGRLLIEYGIVDNENRINGWEMKQDYHIEEEDKRLAYTHSPSFSNELHEISQGYAGLINKAQAINKAIERLEDEKKKENIEEWWKKL